MLRRSISNYMKVTPIPIEVGVLPMASLSHNLYDIPWLAPHMNVLF